MQLGRDLDVQAKTAFVLAHKLRESMSADQDRYAPKGDVEVDGCYIGGSIRQENRKEDRKDRRLAQHQTGKRRVVVVMRERHGRTLPFVVASRGSGSLDHRPPRIHPGSYRPCRRSGLLGCAARPLRDASDQPSGSVQRRRLPAPIRRRASFSRLRRAEYG